MAIRHAAVVGAGIAGLTVALSLARRGIAVEIHEQAETLTEVGAGLQLSPNASDILRRLGLLDALKEHWLEPVSIDLANGRSLARLTEIAARSLAGQRWGAPYAVLHRSTLQKTLLDALEREPLCRLRLGSKVGGERLGKATAGSDVVIGADGVWSSLRQTIPDAPSPRFSGNIAYRWTLPFSDAPAFLPFDRVTAYLGARAHLVCYPLKEVQSFNLVAITAGHGAARDWAQRAGDRDVTQLLDRFREWDPRLRRLIETAAPGLTFWPLYETTTGRWHDGQRKVLIGDAAHAMMPFAAQGAAMAIEDGFELAGYLATRAPEEALPLYEKHRAARIAKMRQRGAFNRFAYHARGPIRLGRDLVFSLVPGERLAADLDWIYGYRAVG